MPAMDSARIQQLLQPFLAAPLPEAQLSCVSTYIDLLLRWNARINLTAVRDGNNIVTRHFGESFFAARRLPPTTSLVDLGSGAGFPGLPIKIFHSQIAVTLIEANHKKATFLREVLRALALKNTEVFTGRGEDFPAASAGVVTIRAVERFENTLPIAARLLAPRGTLALLIGSAQVASARQLLPQLIWQTPVPIPQSSARVLFLGISTEESKV